MIQSRKVPLYSELISIGNNVRVASNVSFITHDVVHNVLNNIFEKKYYEKIGCISIGNNVFIGANSTILYDVKIDDNVIIAAGTVVNKDLESGYVYAGVPAKKIDTFENFCIKRKKSPKYKMPNDLDCIWNDFNKNHSAE